MKDIFLKDYLYNLPKKQIAQFPLKFRDLSKLLVYRDGCISHDIFRNIPNYIHSKNILFFNNTKVMRARLSFYKDSGSYIEIFLLYPLLPSRSINKAIKATGQTTWICIVGNLKRWKEKQVLKTYCTLDDNSFLVSAELINREKQIIRFSWERNQYPFGKLIENLGATPLPPYIKRKTELADDKAYQTIYGKILGAVAAPTAGLHFTKQIIDMIKNKGVQIEEFTLHIGAGTFKPIQTVDLQLHNMHTEQIIIEKRCIEHLCNASNIIAVGTTSLRTLESIYWFGVKILKEKKDDFFIPKLMPYQYEEKDLPSLRNAFSAVKMWMDRCKQEQINGFTKIFIFPGYRFRVCDALITNFHQPGSTLILLIAAFVGKDWKKIYKEALVRNYRFLSYGDSSLLFRDPRKII